MAGPNYFFVFFHGMRMPTPYSSLSDAIAASRELQEKHPACVTTIKMMSL